MAAVRTPTERALNRVAIVGVLVITLIFLAPIYWIASTAFKPRNLATTIPPTVVFTPEVSSFVKLFLKRSQLRTQPGPEEYAAAPWWERLVFDGGEKVVRDGKGNVQLSAYPDRFVNSLIVAIISTVLAVGMGTFTAYGFSRFKVRGESDLLFFILSTRMLPPIVVAIPMYLMYAWIFENVGIKMNDTHWGLIILYTAFNLSFSVWLMKGFIDEIPKEYEEAALVDGYTRMQAFFKIVLPEAATGIAATAVFCFITAWNEYAFALIMTRRQAQTAPPFIPSQIGSGLPDWTVIAAGTLLFLLPVAIFTFLLRNHLLRGMSFGAIRK
jgi:multiple sugar transport system permease protein